jgi:hypothetical protein
VRADIEKRLNALENCVPVIDDLADYVRWQASGRPSNIKWDPIFKKQLEEAFSKGKRRTSE